MSDSDTPATTALVRIHLPEVPVPGKRLGRRVLHDPRSRAFSAPTAPALRSAKHVRLVPPFDQKNVGACTGFAGGGAVCTRPFARTLTNADCLSIYADATKIDAFAGTYPPDDTGSSGLAVAKVLKARGWIRSYSHAFSLDQALRALVLGPGITGIEWLEGCDHPDAHGVVRYTGASRGGHEVELVEVDVVRRLVGFCNSWGGGWGLGGYFFMSFDDYGKALARRGDATFLHA